MTHAVAAAFLLCYARPISGSSLSLSEQLSFEQYHSTFRPGYDPASDEYPKRRALFERRARWIENQNSRPDALWRAGFNQFTDRTDEELQQFRGRRGAGPSGEMTLGPAGLLDVKAELKPSVDWSHLKSLAEVKDQGGCGSCWAFAAANMLTAHYEIHTNKTKYFSPQQFVDCVPNPQECGGTGGCEGATVELAMGYLQKKGGLDILADLDELPYSGFTGECKDGDALVQVKEHSNDEDAEEGGLKIGLQSWETLPSNEALPLMSALQHGPVAISAAASDWFSYTGGVFNSCVQDAIIDHAVLLVGYGSNPDDGVKFWRIQNSWGPSWGESGYLSILRHDTAKEDQTFCGTDHKPEDGIACKPYPKEVTVCGMCGLLFDSVAPKFGKLPVSNKVSFLRGVISHK